MPTNRSGKLSRSGILDVVWLSIVGSNALDDVVLLVADVVSFQAALSRQLDEAVELDFEMLKVRTVTEQVRSGQRCGYDSPVLEAVCGTVSDERLDVAEQSPRLGVNCVTVRRRRLQLGAQTLELLLPDVPRLIDVDVSCV